MEAPQHTWNVWARPGRAKNYNGGERLAPASWLDALARKWERRLVKIDRSISQNFMFSERQQRERDAVAEFITDLRADTESASNVGSEPPLAARKGNE